MSFGLFRDISSRKLAGYLGLTNGAEPLVSMSLRMIKRLREGVKIHEILFTESDMEKNSSIRAFERQERSIHG